MSAKFTASVVGAGTGGKLSMAALRDSDRFELVAVADISPAARQAVAEQFDDVRVFPNHQEMFAVCPTDVVCVSTYPPTHEPIALDALALPLKGILVEKPLGHTVASGRRTLEAVRQRHIPMAVPHGLLVSSTPLEIIARVERGEIGELKLVEIQSTGWDIINAGIHWLDFFVALTGGEPMDYVMAICESSTRTYRDGMQVETTAVTYAQTRSGVRVVMNTGDEILVNRAGKNTLFRIVGTAGQIEFWGWENAYHLLNAEFTQGQLISPPERPGTRHQRHLERLADMMDSGRVDYATPEGSLLALEICEGAYLSSRHRCKVTFPVDQFRPPEPPDWDPGRPYDGTGGGRDGRRL
jgi:predicted dehydrogenase